MKIIVTTSDKYLHLLPIFIYLFKKNWSTEQSVEIVGYKTPDFQLPLNFTFHSLGTQGTVKEFSTDLRKYFELQDDYFIWMMEDSFIKLVDHNKLSKLMELIYRENNIGRINLTNETVKQKHENHSWMGDYKIYANTQDANYRLSTQPSIWNKEFLLKYLTPGLSPWDFETQHSINDGYQILGPKEPAVKHNEGVCKKDIYDYDLNGIEENQIIEMKQLNIL